MVINQINDIYLTKNPRMRAYINEVWDMFDNFFIEHAIRVIPRIENMIVDSLEIAAGRFRIPVAEKKEHKVFIRNRPSIPDNSKYWQVFKNDEQIKRFLEL